jgi:HD superfamily phosphohydrolase
MSDYFSPEKSSKRESDIASLLGKDILEGESMRRLRGVSFLGILNIAAGVPESLRFTRYDHSISVAYLTWLFCKNLGIKEAISLTTTLAALIHDITHPPFSHSTEVYLQMRSGVRTKHTSALTKQKITKVLKEGHNSLPESLRRESPEKLAIKLYDLLIFREERKKFHPYIADIFETPFCPDTFDGINRAWDALNTREVKLRLSIVQPKYFESIDPISLINFISSTTPYPFVFRSSTPPSKANLIIKFHDLMRFLYNSIIYSDWQSSAMVMFARALEIAYQDSTKFEFSQGDAEVIRMIEQNADSKKLYSLIVKGQSFHSLSKENLPLFRKSLDYYAQAKKQNKSYKDTKKAIETMVANELKISIEQVFWHKYRPLIWSPDNFRFNQFGNQDENLWLLKWDPSEGEPSEEIEFEIYYTTLL